MIRWSLESSIPLEFLDDLKVVWGIFRGHTSSLRDFELWKCRPCLGDPLECGGDLVVEHVRVPLGRGDVGVVERLAHEFEIAGLAQQADRGVVPEVVEAEALDARLRAQPPPRGVEAAVR
jgi:hypothetical protein